ncbi:glycosyltransferase family 22 protein [Infundibulicybe gibba]|nr:glycosyltransferase family 22 protein [Infundibulicybe gibba]
MDGSTRVIVFVRILIALCTRTIFQPDEYFQALEPAYNLVFGHGQLTWEWLAPRPIRSIFYPLLNVPVYWILKTSRVSDFGRLGDMCLTAVPKIMHGAFAAITDIYTAKLAFRFIGAEYVSTVTFLSLTSFFHALCLSRSLSNSLETSLSVIAFAYYPWDASSRSSSHLISRLRITIICSALACMVRPTNAVIWIYSYAKLAWFLRSSRRTLLAFVSDILTIGSSAGLVLLVVDSWYYSAPTLTPYNFLITNLSSVSLFYGSSPWHYYLTQGLPILCTTALPFALHGAYTARHLTRETVALHNILGVVMWSIGVYSFAGHKEWRFIHPILPLLYILAAKSLVDLSPDEKPKKMKTKTNTRNSRGKLGALQLSLPPIRSAYIALLLSTIPASFFVILFYCSAPISLVSYIQGLPDAELRDGSIGLLMPCHSIPGQAYIHRPSLEHGGMWALGCEPPLQKQDLSVYQDQTDVFFADPLAYLVQRFPVAVDPTFPPSPFPSSIPGGVPPSHAGAQTYPWVHEWPRRLVLFGALLEEQGVRELLEEKGYKEVWRRGYDWEGEGKRKGGVRVWKWMDNSAY